MSDDHFAPMYQNARAEDLPWYHATPDEDLVALFDEFVPDGARVLDLGAGPAVHSIELAARGCAVVAIDGVPEAKKMANALAEEKGVEIDYRVGDAIRQTPEGPFDVVFDRGFLHTLDPDERPIWRRAVLGALRPGGVAIIKAFDAYPPRDYGPHGMSARDILDALGEPQDSGLRLDWLRHTHFPGHDPTTHAAWAIVATRLRS